MKDSTCAKEELVLAAARSGAWTPELREHLLECSGCSDLVLVDDFLQNDAALALAGASLPDPATVWWRAQLAFKERAMMRAARPVQMAQWAAYIASGAALLWFATETSLHGWLRPGVPKMLSNGGGNTYVLVGAAGCVLSMLLGSVYAVCNDK